MGTLHSLIERRRCAQTVNATAAHDEFFDFLSSLLEEPATASDDKVPRCETDKHVLALIQANARLRAVAIELSNLVGDLPAWAGAGEGDHGTAEKKSAT